MRSATKLQSPYNLIKFDSIKGLLFVLDILELLKAKLELFSLVVGKTPDYFNFHVFDKKG